MKFLLLFVRHRDVRSIYAVTLAYMLLTIIQAAFVAVFIVPWFIVHTFNACI